MIYAVVLLSDIKLRKDMIYNLEYRARNYSKKQISKLLLS